MPKVISTQAVGDNEAAALVLAMANVIGELRQAVERPDISYSTEKVSGGVRLYLHVTLMQMDELPRPQADSPQEDEEKETGAYIPYRREPSRIDEYAYFQSAQALEREREEMFNQSIEELAHPQENIPGLTVETQFEEAAQPSDASYIYREYTYDNDNEDSPARIVTEIAQDEIQDSVRHEVLSAGTVEWAPREMDAQMLDPAEPRFDDSQAEGLPPERIFQKEAKKRPPPEDMELVA